MSNELRAKIKELPKIKKTELLKFMEYLQSYKNSSFIKYINDRTRQALQNKKIGKHFISLEELQRNHVWGIQP